MGTCYSYSWKEDADRTWIKLLTILVLLSFASGRCLGGWTGPVRGNALFEVQVMTCLNYMGVFRLDNIVALASKRL